jgi:hypothetical protein
VNDCVHVQRALVHRLVENRIRPYYLYQCDLVEGSGHFRTPVGKGLEIIEGLRGHVSGLGVPTYVIDGLHGAGKIPVMPNYLISASPDAVVLRNYEGMIFRYAPEHHDEPQAAGYESLGVSSLLGGAGAPLVPEGNRRLARRHAREQAAEHGPRAEAPSDTLPTDDPPPVLLPILHALSTGPIPPAPSDELGEAPAHRALERAANGRRRNGRGSNGHASKTSLRHSRIDDASGQPPRAKIARAVAPKRRAGVAARARRSGEAS